MRIDMFKILGDENRWKILKILAKKPTCVCKIEASLGLRQNLVSHHLKVLKEAGFIENCRCGKNNFYSLNTKKIKEVINMISKLIKE
jgi:ArsR family transcriptional regulator